MRERVNSEYLIDAPSMHFVDADQLLRLFPNTLSNHELIFSNFIII